MPLFRTGHPRLLCLPASDVSTAAGQQIANLGAATIDDVGGWDGADTYTFDRPGLWLMGTQVRRAAAASASSINVRLRWNGVNYFESLSLSTSAVAIAATTGMFLVAEGDTMEVSIRLHSSLTTTLEKAGTWLWGSRIGPKAWT